MILMMTVMMMMMVSTTTMANKYPGPGKTGVWRVKGKEQKADYVLKADARKRNNTEGAAGRSRSKKIDSTGWLGDAGELMLLLVELKVEMCSERASPGRQQQQPSSRTR